MNPIMAIDPGPVQSAVVTMDGDDAYGDILTNSEMLFNLSNASLSPSWVLVVEMIASYGMPVGRSVFDTCLWIGRFLEAWGGDYRLVTRKSVVTTVCGSSRAKDSNVRQAMLDLYPATGGGKTPQVGTKNQPGPLYGIKSDMWAALAVAHAYMERGDAIAYEESYKASERLVQ